MFAHPVQNCMTLVRGVAGVISGTLVNMVICKHCKHQNRQRDFHPPKQSNKNKNMYHDGHDASVLTHPHIPDPWVTSLPCQLTSNRNMPPSGTCPTWTKNSSLPAVPLQWKALVDTQNPMIQWHWLHHPSKDFRLSQNCPHKIYLRRLKLSSPKATLFWAIYIRRNTWSEFGWIWCRKWKVTLSNHKTIRLELHDQHRPIYLQLSSNRTHHIRQLLEFSASASDDHQIWQSDIKWLCGKWLPKLERILVTQVRTWMTFLRKEDLTVGRLTHFESSPPWSVRMTNSGHRSVEPWTCQSIIHVKIRVKTRRKKTYSIHQHTKWLLLVGYGRMIWDVLVLS